MISGAPGPTRARDAAAAAAAAAAADDDDDDDDDARGSTRVTGWSLQTIAAVVCARNEGILARGQAFSLVHFLMLWVVLSLV